MDERSKQCPFEHTKLPVLTGIRLPLHKGQRKTCPLPSNCLTTVLIFIVGLSPVVVKIHRSLTALLQGSLFAVLFLSYHENSTSKIKAAEDIFDLLVFLERV